MSNKNLIDDLCTSKRTDVRAYAAKALGGLQDNEAIKPLIEAFLRDPDQYVREMAIKALARFRDSDAVGTLMKTVAGYKNKDIIRAVTQALGLVQDGHADEPLLNLYFLTGDPELKDACIWALGNQKMKAAAAVFCESMLVEKKKHIVKTIAGALNKFDDPNIIDMIAVKLLHEKDENKRENAAIALGEFPDARVHSFLLRSLREDADPDVRFEAAESLSRSGWTPDIKGEAVYFYLAKRHWRKIKELGAFSINPIVRILKITNFPFDDEKISKPVFSRYLSILYSCVKTVVFGEGELEDEYSTLQNPDVKYLDGPLKYLERVIIRADTYHQKTVESFITYAVNHIDDAVLKNRVDVLIEGEREKIYPNLYNLISNHFQNIKPE
ncbi:MAG: HEAT repeat domain-containing protein [Spirochaetales bacterium]|nr:HEAT repeat domain-containing protein [Spirochaetales bacterium]